MKKQLPALFLFIPMLGWAQPGALELASASDPTGERAFELINFQAEPLEAGVALQWTTAQEAPGCAFIVERSTDRMNWSAVATEAGRGGRSDLVAYGTTDPDPFDGVAYYRLNLLRNGSAETISEDFGVERSSPMELLIKGDRASRHFTVLGRGRISDLQVLNNRGQFLAMEMDYQGDRVVVNGDHLEPGTYFVQAIVDGSAVLRQLTVTTTAVIGG